MKIYSYNLSLDYFKTFTNTVFVYAADFKERNDDISFDMNSLLIATEEVVTDFSN